MNIIKLYYEALGVCDAIRAEIYDSLPVVFTSDGAQASEIELEGIG